jgi:ParB family chromosome partitioning protein
MSKIPLKDGQGRFRVDEIDVPDRLRSLNEDRLPGLMQSMEVIGLRSAITVATVAGDEDTVDGLTLVAGRHRLEAARRLGWEKIDAIVADDLDDLERRLWEIDENLQRAELTALERDEHVARRKELWEHLRKREHREGTTPDEDPFPVLDRWKKTETGQSQASLGGRGKKGFAAETAAATGMSKSAINSSIRRHDRIPPDIREQIQEMPEIAGKNVELDSLASLKPTEQRRAVEMVRDGEAQSVRDAKLKLGLAPKMVVQDRELRAQAEKVDDAEDLLQRLQTAWSDADERTRRRFHKWLEDKHRLKVVSLPARKS